MSVLSVDLIQTVLVGYTLPLHGTHGIRHWARVYENGIRLADGTGASVEVVKLFSLLHDSQRINESVDPGHGQRAADFALSLRGSLIELADDDFEQLYIALAFHTEGRMQGAITTLTCWDADRLDLARAGIHPSPRRLCTPQARDAQIISWATDRSLSDFMPAIVNSDWLKLRE
jgi:uncharacterized protein